MTQRSTVERTYGTFVRSRVRWKPFRESVIERVVDREQSRLGIVERRS